jgi:hypothetical protein
MFYVLFYSIFNLLCFPTRQSVTATLRGELSRALYGSSPPPRGSELHAKLVAAAAGALFHGQASGTGELARIAREP